MIYHLIEYYINLPSTDLLNYTGKLESRDFYYEIRECSLHFNTALQRQQPRKKTSQLHYRIMATRWQIIITFNCYEIISLFDQIIVGAEYVDGEKKIVYQAHQTIGWETTFNNK